MWPFQPDAELIQRKEAHTSHVESLAITSHDQKLAIVSSSSDGTVHVWQPELANSVTALRRFSSQAVSTTAVTSDGRWIVAGTYDGSVWIWDWTSQSNVAYKIVSGESQIEQVLISPDGRWVIAGGPDGVVHVWNLRQLQLLALTRPTPSNESAPEAAGPDPDHDIVYSF